MNEKKTLPRDYRWSPKQILRAAEAVHADYEVNPGCCIQPSSDNSGMFCYQSKKGTVYFIISDNRIFMSLPDYEGGTACWRGDISFFDFKGKKSFDIAYKTLNSIRKKVYVVPEDTGDHYIDMDLAQTFSTNAAQKALETAVFGEDDAKS